MTNLLILSVLERIWAKLDCDFSDLVNYKKPEEETNKND